MTLINLTPHAVTVIIDDQQQITIPPSGQVARCTEITESNGAVNLDGFQIPVVKKRFGQVLNLPPKQEGVYYIVSLAVAQAARRDDLLIPDELVRDKNGVILGCRRFAKVM